MLDALAGLDLQHLLDPPLRPLERTLLGYVVYYQCGVGSAEVHFVQCAVLLLTGRVPELDGDQVALIIVRDLLRFEADSERRHRVGLELVGEKAREYAGFAHAPIADDDNFLRICLH